MYTLYERLILNRIAPSVDRHLIKEQAGFRPGKSCCSQLLNLTQHIEDDDQRGMITGTAFVDLSAAHDTVNHRLVIRKLYDFTKDSPLCRVIQNMLLSRRLYVELNNDRSRWRNQKNGFPQGSVLDKLTTYYRSNNLSANPDKTQVTSFHLKNREAKRKLQVEWKNTDLERIRSS